MHYTNLHQSPTDFDRKQSHLAEYPPAKCYSVLFILFLLKPVSFGRKEEKTISCICGKMRKETKRERKR